MKTSFGLEVRMHDSETNEPALHAFWDGMRLREVSDLVYCSVGVVRHWRAGRLPRERAAECGIIASSQHEE